MKNYGFSLTLNIAFAVNFLARHSASPKMCHGNDIKNIL
jgi:hypothetical protein